MWYVCDVLYEMLYVCVCCFVVRGCAVSRMYIDVCYCDMCSVVSMYHYHLKFFFKRKFTEINKTICRIVEKKDIRNTFRVKRNEREESMVAMMIVK